ncbi:MAG: hypothetical protein ABSB40_00210 [Nitrososphaeria archaeon]
MEQISTSARASDKFDPRYGRKVLALLATLAIVVISLIGRTVCLQV